jgi:hypothetical protein
MTETSKFERYWVPKRWSDTWDASSKLDMDVLKENGMQYISGTCKAYLQPNGEVWEYHNNGRPPRKCKSMIYHKLFGELIGKYRVVGGA